MDTGIIISSPVILRKLHHELALLGIAKFIGLYGVGPTTYVIVSSTLSEAEEASMNSIIAVHNPNEDHPDSFYEAL